MEYNKSLLKSWIDDPQDESADEDMPYDEWRESWRLGLRSCLQLNKRIAYCKNLLRNHKDAFLYHVLAELYDEYDFSHSEEILHKRPVRYYCVMAIRKDRNYAPAWALLSAAHWWLSLIRGTENSFLEADIDLVEETEMLFQEIEKIDRHLKSPPDDGRRHIEKAICYIQKAIKADPAAEHYQSWFQCYCRERNELYK